MDYEGLAMLGSWDSVPLRLFGAAALAAGLHAWRQLRRARQHGTPPSGGRAEEPLLVACAAPKEEGEVPESAASPAEEVAAGASPPVVFAAPVGVPAQQEEARQEEGEDNISLQPSREPVPVAMTQAAGGGTAALLEGEAADQQPAAPPSAVPATALAAPPPPQAAASALPKQEQQEQVALPLEQQAASASAIRAHPDADTFTCDPADVHPAALGSPFVPPSLGSLPGAAAVEAGGAGAGGTPSPAIPLFSTFAPPQSLGAAAEEGALAGAQPRAKLGAAAAATPACSPGSKLGGSGFGSEQAAGGDSSGSSQPRHSRRRSLLSAGLDQGQQSLEEQQAQLEVEQELLQGQQWLRAKLAAKSEGPAESAAPSGGQGGRPELRVELPFEAEPEAEHEGRQQSPAAAASRYSPQAGEQKQLSFIQFQTPPQHLYQPGPTPPGARGSTPLGFHQQADAEAASAAAAAAAAWGTQHQYQQHAASSGPTPDSVATVLERAVHLAASGTAAGYSGSSGGGSGGSLASHHHVPGGSGSGFSGGANLRTFRSGSLGHPQPQPHGYPGGLGQGSGGDSAWGDVGFSMLAERSMTSRSDRHLPRLSEEVEGVRSSVDVDVPLACKLDVVAGPCTNRGYTNTEDVLEIIIGRNQGATMQLNDGEISGQHVAVRWSSVDKCWKVADLGSLNGTLLNGEPISVVGRKRGCDYRLSTDDILQLGSYTKIKVSTFPWDLLDPMQSRCGSLPVGSMPKSLTMPKHRIPSFSSLLSPKITNTPSKKATVAAASDELRLECCIVSRTGRDHQRKGQMCEDVACAECPLHGSEAALGGEHPAALFCVFDGHCGRGAADAASVTLPDEVASRLQGVRAELLAAAGAEEMLQVAFLATDEAIGAEEGCTATAVLMWRDGQGAVCLQAANVGDSAALFIDPQSQQAVELTEDHRLTNPRERQRLQDMGIQLASNARRLYGLNLCRGLGDKFLKDEDLGLSAEPHVSPVVRLSEEQGGILLIASDGLWDVADADAVTQAICQADREKDGSVLEATNAVIGHALKQRTKDDVTALVVRVWPASEWELRSPTKNLDDGESVAFVG